MKEPSKEKGASEKAQASARRGDGNPEPFHRTPPHSTEAEQGTLGSILVSPRDSLEECMAKISPGHFYIPAHQIIYEQLVSLYEARSPIDLIGFTQLLRDRSLLDSVGGPAFITSLFTYVMTAANLGYYLQILRDQFTAREMIRIGTEIARIGYDEVDNIRPALDKAQADITALSMESTKTDAMRHIADGVGDALDHIDLVYHNRGDAAVVGLASGFYDLDRMTTGLKPADMIVIAARPSLGKTALGMNIAEHVAMSGQGAVAVFSLEMTYTDLTRRLACSVAGISLQRLRDGFFGRETVDAVPAKLTPLRMAPIYIDDTPSLWISDFKARARRAVAQLKVKLIVVDYLQLLVSPSRRAQDNRVIEITEISAGIKNTAKELGIPIIVMAQLNRDAEKRNFGAPKLADLRESGSIEQDADIVGLIWRPIRHVESRSDMGRLARFLRVTTEKGILEIEEEKRAGWTVLDDEHGVSEYLKGFAQLIIAKQRNGPVGEVPLIFEEDTTRFKNQTTKMWSNNPNERQHGQHTTTKTEIDDEF